MASILKVDKLDPQSGTALEIGTSGDTISVPSGATLDISSATLTPPATMPASSAANLTNIPGANITGTIAAVSGANLTSLNATNLGSGTVPTARLGTGTASSSTVLYGDNAWAAAGGGKILQVVSASTTTLTTTTSTTWDALVPSVDITPSADTSKILVMWTDNNIFCNSTGYYYLTIMRDTSTNLGHGTYGNILGYGAGDDPPGAPSQCSCVVLDDPATDSSVNYCVYGKTVTGTALYTSNGATCYITAMEIGA